MKRSFIISIAIMATFAAFAQGGRDATSTALQKYVQTMYYINNYYLDTVNFNSIVDKAIVASLNELDPHSSFISAADVKAMNEPLEGEFEGIGVEFAIIHDTLTVQAPVAGGPSERVGIRAGDKIIKVGEENVAGVSLTNEKVFKYLRGPKGTKVNLTVLRRDEPESLLFTVVRDKIPINSLDASYQPKPGYVYLKLSRFAASSHKEILDVLKQTGKVKGIILDLRGNSGGYLTTAINIANEFLESGEVIVYTEGRTVKPMKEYADGAGKYRSGPLVVLIDENSASASEIVAGAVQDWDRGVVIGRRSFGKGLVQQALPLSDGSQLRLTIAKYHTPSGRVIQAPYEKGNASKYYKDFYERYLKGESFSKDSIHFPDSLKYSTLKKERIVFGGGGIMPDIFVPQDTSYYTKYYASLLRRGVVTEYMNDVIDSNRDSWKKKYKSFEIFDQKFEVTDEMFRGLIGRAKEKGIEPDEQQIATSRDELKYYMKALAASSIFTRNDFYRVINSNNDHIFEKAIEVLDNWDTFYKQLK